MEAVVYALLGKLIALFLAIPFVIGVVLGFFVGRAAGRIAAHREFQAYAQLSAQQGHALMPPEPRGALGGGRPRRRAA